MARPQDENAGDAGQGAAGKVAAWWQWAVAGSGALLLGGTIATLVWAHFETPAEPAKVTISLLRIDRVAPDRFLALVAAANAGGQTLAGVKIVGDLRRGGEVVESADFTLDYLPAGASREGGLFFAEDPRSPGLRLDLHPSGYHNP
jgi:uncharacterized protein (TIGR02588 family)